MKTYKTGNQNTLQSQNSLYSLQTSEVSPSHRDGQKKQQTKTKHYDKVADQVIYEANLAEQKPSAQYSEEMANIMLSEQKIREYALKQNPCFRHKDQDNDNMPNQRNEVFLNHCIEEQEENLGDMKNLIQDQIKKNSPYLFPPQDDKGNFILDSKHLTQLFELTSEQQKKVQGKKTSKQFPQPYNLTHPLEVFSLVFILNKLKVPCYWQLGNHDAVISIYERKFFPGEEVIRKKDPDYLNIGVSGRFEIMQKSFQKKQKELLSAESEILNSVCGWGEESIPQKKLYISSVLLLKSAMMLLLEKKQ